MNSAKNLDSAPFIKYKDRMKKPRQLTFKKVNGWGGKRRGAGRKNVSGQVSHGAREEVDFKKPLHITKRLKPGLKSLRSSKMRSAFQKCLERARQKGLRVLHFSLESNHFHFIVECENNAALAAGMNSLGASLGRLIRKASGGRGPVFEGRYHLHVLKEPREVRHALAYVLLNHSKHAGLIPYKDDFSSAAHFHDWKSLLGKDVGPILEDWRKMEKPLPPHLCQARSWLAREGWRKA